MPRNTPLVADLNGDGVPDVTIVDGAGDILFREGVPGEPGSFDPPITINAGSPSRDIAAVATSQGTLLASVDATDNAVSLFAYHNGQFSLARQAAHGRPSRRRSFRPTSKATARTTWSSETRATARSRST